ncbi:MAG: hypothetical protein IJZ10_03285 [Thermoguttaceae bacterium]|nr:hypothetical protein [Thermoguttaceae bacterium]
MTPQTPPVSSLSDAASTHAVETLETPKRRRFPTLTLKPLLWTVAILAPPLAYVAPIGFFLGNLLGGSTPTVDLQFCEMSRSTFATLYPFICAAAFFGFVLAAPLGTVASVGAFRRSRRVWAKALAALLIVANVWLLLTRPGVFLLEDVTPEFVVDFLLSI